jgi:hypothetical protein
LGIVAGPVSLGIVNAKCKLLAMATCNLQSGICNLASSNES